MKALWHRHWVDAVGGLIVGVPIAIFLSVVFAVIAFVHTQAGLEDAPFVVRDALPPTLISATDASVVWSVHAMITIIASWGLILFITGTGIRSNNLYPRHPSIYFNLALPVSRTRLIVTRFAFCGACAAGLLSIILMINSLALLILGLPVPFTEMALTSLMAALCLATLVAIFNALAIASETLAILVISISVILLVLLGAPEIYYRFMAELPLSAARIFLLAAVVGLALMASIVTAHKRDY